jgi:hypothetical protein
MRQETGDRRQETGDRRQESGIRSEEKWSIRVLEYLNIGVFEYSNNPISATPDF